MQEKVLSVRQLNLYVRSVIEGDPLLASITVSGEISNFKNHYSSGHWYFTLKDNDAAIRCVMFRGNAIRVKFQPADGLQVLLRGRVSIYEKDGQYQFYAEDMIPAGIGDIALKFEQIKERLQKEGLFDPSSKRSLPKFPENIAVITSATGAAVQDILNILGRRWPLASVILCPVSVQGELAVPEMIDALERLYALGKADVIIIGRGGGSIEDLWAFNSEELARKIYESPIPVISAVGHETDFTICDFVADLRAPTPSAAAELAVPDINEITATLNKYANILKNSLGARLNLSKAKFTSVTSSYYLKKPLDAFFERNYLETDRLFEQLCNAVNKKREACASLLSSSIAGLDALSPLKVMSRGFAAVLKEEKNVTSVSQLKTDDIISVRLSDGSADCRITDIIKE